MVLSKSTSVHPDVFSYRDVVVLGLYDHDNTQPTSFFYTGLHVSCVLGIVQVVSCVLA